MTIALDDAFLMMLRTRWMSRVLIDLRPLLNGIGLPSTLTMPISLAAKFRKL